MTIWGPEFKTHPPSSEPLSQRGLGAAASQIRGMRAALPWLLPVVHLWRSRSQNLGLWPSSALLLHTTAPSVTQSQFTTPLKTKHNVVLSSYLSSKAVLFQLQCLSELSDKFGENTEAQALSCFSAQMNCDACQVWETVLHSRAPQEFMCVWTTWVPRSVDIEVGWDSVFLTSCQRVWVLLIHGAHFGTGSKPRAATSGKVKSWNE